MKYRSFFISSKNYFKGRLAAILETDLYQENKELKSELKNQENKNNKDIDDLVESYNYLHVENTFLRSQIGDLKEEIKSTYQSTKILLKDRTGDLKSFKEVFRALVDSISFN